MKSLGVQVTQTTDSSNPSLNSMDEVLDEILSISAKEEMNSYQKITKLVEELGELSEAILSYSGAVGCEYKCKTKEDVLEEACDTSIRALSILACDVFTKEEILEMMAKKISKWKSKVLK